MTDIQQARYDRVFDAYVHEGEYFTAQHFEDHVARLAEIRGLAADDPKSDAFRMELAATWAALAGIADTDNDGRVSRDEWRAACQGITAGFLAAKGAGQPLPMQDWITVLYDMIDADGDGRVTESEYADWLAALDLLKDTDLPAIFAGFDKNEDGYLSRQEFADTYVEYWTVFDDSVPGHRWIGP